MVRPKRNPQRKEAEMSLPSMTTAFCLSGIAGLALTSAAMPPIGDGSAHHQLRCELSAKTGSCVSATTGTMRKPGYAVTVPSPADTSLRSHCRTAAHGGREQAQIQIAANCVGGRASSTANRLD